MVRRPVVTFSAGFDNYRLCPEDPARPRTVRKKPDGPRPLAAAFRSPASDAVAWRPRGAGAADVIAIIKAHHIVDVWSNEVAQNNMRNAIDDYFFDVLRDRNGVELPVDLLDELEQRLMDLARARFPD